MPQWTGLALALAAAALVGAHAAGEERAPLAAALAAGYAAVLATLAWTDLRGRRIPNRLVLPVLALALAAAVVGLGPGPAAAALGCLVAAGPFALLFLAAPPPALGAGDVKLAALVGAIAGVPEVFGALLLATVTGALAALVLRLHRPGARRQTMAYGPYLAVGGLVALV